MPVGRRLAVDRAAQVEAVDDRGGAQVEVLVDQPYQVGVRQLPGPECLECDRGRMRDADRVGDLHLDPVRQPRRDDVAGDVPGGVRGRAVHLRRVFATEGAAAVAGDAAVGVDDDLAAGQPGVARRTARDEAPGRVHVDLALVDPGEQFGRTDGVDHEPPHVLAQLLDANAGVVLRGDDDRLEALRAAVLVLHRDLRLAVRAQVGQHAALAQRRQPLCEPVREPDRERDVVRRLVAGEADHHPLVARADPVVGVLGALFARLEG